MQNGDVNPRDLKLELGESLVSMYHGTGAAKAAREGFIRQFSQRQSPTEIESCIIVSAEPQMRLAEIIVKASGAATLGEAKRKIQQGGVRVGDTTLTDPQAMVDTANSFLLNVGKRFYRKIEFKR
jgi:tyrosyl-tRNA synthetase